MTAARLHLYDRGSPANAERSILGAILLDPHFFNDAGCLCPDDFSLDSHRRIFARMMDLDAAKLPIDIITLQEELSRHKEVEAIGGVAYLASLTDGLPRRPSIEHYVRIVQDYAIRRQFAKHAEDAQRQALDPSVPTTALAEAGSRMSEIAAAADVLPPQFSEEALALRFSRQYAASLRYVNEWGRWMSWDGMYWREDRTLDVFDRVRAVCRKASAECGNNEKAGIRLASGITVAAVERLVRADRRHAAAVEQWDCDPWLLNTPSGTVDLLTGIVREHQPGDYITKITAAGPGGDCPLWKHFLARIMEDEPELQTFLQRVTGYSLTGLTREHALFFLYGTGANGKSVFLSTLAGLLGDYAKAAPVSTFTASNTEQHPTDVAGLRGARMVTALETEDGRWWAEAKVKSLTGGDRITARFMRQDFFEYVPQFKLIVAGNHKPGLRNVDEAIRRRLHLVPFTVTIGEEERDPDLGEKLKAEFPGILRWAIEGCLAWQREGLNPPTTVRAATGDYLAAEDAVGRWIEDHCVIHPACWAASGALYAAYQEWCQQNGERQWSQKRFSETLRSRGFEPARTGAVGTKGFAGIGLREDVVTDASDASSGCGRTRARTPYIGKPV